MGAQDPGRIYSDQWRNFRGAQEHPLPLTKRRRKVKKRGGNKENEYRKSGSACSLFKHLSNLTNADDDYYSYERNQFAFCV